MAVSSVNVSADIPDILKDYYLGTPVRGTPAVGTEGQPGYQPASSDYQPAIPGLISKGIDAIYPSAEATDKSVSDYNTRYQGLIDAGLMGAEGVADLSTYQELAGQRIGNMAIPGAFADASAAGASAATGLKGLQNYSARGVSAQGLRDYSMSAGPSVSAQDVKNYQMSGVAPISAPQVSNFRMDVDSQVATNPLTQYQMASPDMFDRSQAQRYMSPYMQEVVDSQSRMAIDAAKKAQLSNNLAAARQGTYGGARQALLQGEREQGLRTQLGDIQAMGLQKAYEQAQTQFERDRASQQQAGMKNLEALLGVQNLGSTQGLQAQQLNQAAALEAARQNLNAQLQSQQLGVNAGMQAALANQGAALDVGKQNLAANLGVQQLGVDSGLRAALANQAAALEANKNNLAASLGVQQLGAQQNLEAQRLNQAADLSAAGLQMDASKGLGSLAGVMGNVGTQELAGEMDITKMVGAYGDLQRGVTQQQYNAEKDYLTNSANYAQNQVGDYSSLLRGIPMNSSTQTTTTPPPSFGSTLAGAGVAGLGVYNMMNSKN
jgi:hypothetical protein